MANRLVINVDAVDDLLSTAGYGAGSLLRLERSNLPTSGFGEISTTALVAGKTQYDVWDSSGSDGSYYRTRYSDSVGSSASDYSDVFQASSIAAYATLDDLLETMDLPDERRYNLLADLLADASAYIDGQCNRRFYRNPQVSGDGVFTFNVKHRGQRTLSEAIGEGIDIASVTSLEVADSTGSTFTTIPSTDYFKLPDQPDSGFPWTDVGLSNVGSQYWYPGGYGVIRLTGVLGFLTVPPLVKRATVDLARTWYQASVGGAAPQTGSNQFNVPVFAGGMPPTVQAVTDSYGPYVRKSFVWV